MENRLFFADENDLIGKIAKNDIIFCNKMSKCTCKMCKNTI